MTNIYSIIESFGRQFWVEPNKFQDFSNFKITRKPSTLKSRQFRIDYSHTPERATSILFDRVMFFADQDNVQLGKPLLENFRVEGSLLPGIHKKSKLFVFKMRSKKRFRRKLGCRISTRRIRFDNILQITKTKSNLQILVKGSSIKSN
uniref:Ribosomal protein L21 n=1 Tax=Characiopsis acuta TaxID=2040456 RepID=A0A451FLN4_9STRA|nr:ribosomal protein L21 [Characiopsis acuta]QAA11283.1 ribosomal protein L21 [Characiopsis acuta]